MSFAEIIDLRNETHTVYNYIQYVSIHTQKHLHTDSKHTRSRQQNNDDNLLDMPLPIIIIFF